MPAFIKTRLLLLAIYLLTNLVAQAQTITTVAGTGTPGYSGDAGQATAAQLNSPFGIAIDKTGNLYIADRLNNRIRKVNAGGVITTVAGTGTGGYNGDMIAATAAEINNITGVAVDTAGNIYIADKGNNRIRKVEASGIIHTVAGNGAAAYSGDGGQATDASLNSPRFVAVDKAGNLYIADQGNNRVRKVDGSGIIYTIAGTSATGYNGDNLPATDAELKGPYCIAVDKAGNIYIADVDNYRIRKINTAGIISTIAGNGTQGYSGDGGSATNAQLNEAIGICLDSAGNLFIADGWNARIRYVNNNGFITTLAGNGTAGYNGDGIAATTAQLNNPYGVAVNSTGDLYIADYSNSRIRQHKYPLSLNNIPSEPAEISIYPNPSNGTFNILMKAANRVGQRITITNQSGRKVKEVQIGTNNITPITLNEPSGIYFLQLPGENGNYTKEIILAK